MVVVAPPDSTNARKLAESGSCRGLLVVSQKGVSSCLDVQSHDILPYYVHVDFGMCVGG